MTAAQILNDALARITEEHIIPPCASDPDRWFADSHLDRADAAAECDGCVVFIECDAAASEIRPRFGVWAGRDWTWTTRKGAAA